MRGYNRILIFGINRRALVSLASTVGICAVLALAMLAIGADPAGAAPAGQTVNDQPTFLVGTATREVPENSPVDTEVGTPIQEATDTDGDAIYQLDGDDKDYFKIDSITRQISVGEGTTLNFEARSTYVVEVQVTDNKDATGNRDAVIDDTVQVTINVTDEDEPPGKPALTTVRVASADPDTALEVHWTAPATNTGPPIIDYDVQYRAGSGGFVDAGYTGTGTSATISGLQPDTDYQVQVRARNDEGDGRWSDSGTGAPLVQLPCPTLVSTRTMTIPGVDR